MANDITPDELEERLEWIDALHEEQGVNAEADAERERIRKVDIYDDLIHVTTDVRVLHIPQPTLGFIMLYQERRAYFEDDEHGLGRLLVALRRMEDPGFVRGLRMGRGIPDDAADEELNRQGVYGEDVAEYYIAIEGAIKYANEETEKKTKKLLAQRAGLDSDLMERLLSLSNLPGTPLSTLSTECTSGPSEP